MGLRYVYIIVEKKYVLNVLDLKYALINFEKVVVLNVMGLRSVFMAIVSMYAWNVPANIYANTNEYKVNARNAKADLYVFMINEKQHVSYVLLLAAARTVNQYLSLDQNGIPTVFVAIVF
jgi:hypothetical protein